MRRLRPSENQLTGTSNRHRAPAPVLGWGMALVFGLGQAGAALVLHSNVERSSDGR